MMTDIHVDVSYSLHRIMPQARTSSAIQERELKETLNRVQEEAQKQLELVNGQLQGRSAEVKEKERELGELRHKLEGEVASLQQQLVLRNEELQTAQKTVNEVSLYIFK